MILLSVAALILFMVLRNVVKIQLPNPSDMFVSFNLLLLLLALIYI